MNNVNHCTRSLEGTTWGAGANDGEDAYLYLALNLTLIGYAKPFPSLPKTLLGSSTSTCTAGIFQSEIVKKEAPGIPRGDVPGGPTRKGAILEKKVSSSNTDN